MQLHSGGLLVRQACKLALYHVLGVPIGQLDAGPDDAPARPLPQDLALWGQVPSDGECQPFHTCPGMVNISMLLHYLICCGLLPRHDKQDKKRLDYTCLH